MIKYVLTLLLVTTLVILETQAGQIDLTRHDSFLRKVSDVSERRKFLTAEHAYRNESHTFSIKKDLLADPYLFEKVAKRNGMTAMRFANQSEDSIMAMVQDYLREEENKAQQATNIPQKTSGKKLPTELKKQSSKHGIAKDVTPASMLKKLKTMYHNTTFQAIRKSPVFGLYEVVMGENIAYTDESGRYFVFGHLFDMYKQNDLTAKTKLDRQKSKFPAQFLHQAMKTVKGDGSRHVAVFSDPDCHYCQRLERELTHLDNVTLYTFLYPMSSLHPEAKMKAVSVWCSPNQAKTWAELMLGGKTPKQMTCANPIDNNLLLGARLGVVGTPTLIAHDGRVLPGPSSAAIINHWLDANEPTQETRQ